ncbi:MAG: hypothetical protein AAF412_05480, partial [Pseudomonadota bacterium]
EEVGKLREKYSDTEQSLKGKEIEISANKATIEALRGTVSSIDMSDEKQLDEIHKLRGYLASAEERLEMEKQNSKEAVDRAKLAERELRSTKKQAEKTSKQLMALKTTNVSDNENSSDLNAQLIEEKAKTVELEAKIAKHALQTEALLNDASNENVQEALRTMNHELDEKADTVRILRQERDTLSEELAAIKATAEDDWSDERQEKAFLRQRINDLAAKFAAMTAEMEGPSSPIQEMLKEEVLEEEAVSGSSEMSLADRIKAIQEAASSR